METQPGQQPADEVTPPEPAVDAVVDDSTPEIPAAITAEEVRDRAVGLYERGREVFLGPVWEAGRVYMQGISDGVNAVLDGLIGGEKK